MTTPAQYFHVLRRQVKSPTPTPNPNPNPSSNPNPSPNPTTTPTPTLPLTPWQVVREFRKPLIVMSPKSLLRHRLVKSPIEDLATGTSFHRYIADTGDGLVPEPDKMRKLILCSGKVYFDLLLEREKLGVTDVAISRVEQVRSSSSRYERVRSTRLRSGW